MRGGSLIQIAGFVLVAGASHGLSTGAVAQTAEDRAVARYVTTEVCVACHEDAASRWRGSHHALAWQEPNDEAMLGDFEGATFEHKGAVSRFARKDGRYFVETEADEGRSETFEVVGVAGIAPLQQVLVETEPGRLQALDVAWDDVDKRWYHLYPDLELAPRDGLNWTGPYKNWNARCAECHATGFEKNYDPAGRRYSSAQAEIGVGCEACHGPGEAHVAWANDDAAFDPTAWRAVDGRGFTFAFKPADPEAEIQQCAGCHSRREPLGDATPPPGTAFHDAFRLARLRDGLYHPDGQIRDEVYVYGSFLQSRMYARGVRCSNCHEPHSGALRAEGNAVCAQCHGPAGNANFPSLKLADYDTPDHHFHPPGSEGAECTSCHMIYRVYMGIDARRDHSFRVPRPDLSVALGTPNACTDCHAGGSAAWAAGEVAARFPDSGQRGEHFSPAFAAAWSGRGDPETVNRLIAIASDPTWPGLVRASALEALVRFSTPEIADRTEALLRDGDPLVRASAVPLQIPAPPATRLHRTTPLLQDGLRSVRIEAVRGLIDLFAGGLFPVSDPSAQSAMREYQQSLMAKADFPETQMAIAGTALTFHEFIVAERAFAEAVRMDPQLVDGWVMIARLRAAMGDGAGSEDALKTGLMFNPENASLTQLLQAMQDSEGIR